MVSLSVLLTIKSHTLAPGGSLLLNANGREFPDLIRKVQISKIALRPTISNEVIFLIHVASGLFTWGWGGSNLCFPGGLVYIQMPFSWLNCGWPDWAAGGESVACRTTTCSGFHRTVSFPDTIWPEKHPFGKNCMFLRPWSEVFIYNHCAGSSLTSFCYT